MVVVCCLVFAVLRDDVFGLFCFCDVCVVCRFVFGYGVGFPLICSALR